MISNVAKIVKWDTKKAFGFAEVNGKRYFVHRTALGEITRNPIVGDTIIVTQFIETPKGSRISSGTLEGVSVITRTTQDFKKNHPCDPGCYRRRKLRFAFVALLISLPIMGIVKCSEMRSEPNNPPLVFEKIEPRNSQKFHCDGRTHCSQMNSYEEAVFFLNNCPSVEMDGDGDGIPCERQFGR